MSVDQVESSLIRFPIAERYLFKKTKLPLPNWSVRIGLFADPVMTVWFDHMCFTREGMHGDHWGHMTFSRLGRFLVNTSSSYGSEDFAISTLSAVPKFLDQIGMVKIWPAAVSPPENPTLIPETTILELAADLAETRQGGIFPDRYRQQTLVKNV